MSKLSTIRILHPIIPSCRPGEFEIQPGEEVRIELNGLNPQWPQYIKSLVLSPIRRTETGREYLLQFDEDQLRGGPMFSNDSIKKISGFSPVDALREETLNPLPPSNVIVMGKAGEETFMEPVSPEWNAQGEAEFQLSSRAVSISLRWEKGTMTVLSANGGIVTGVFRNFVS